MVDAPVPLMEQQLLVDAFAAHDIQVPEQVIEVPKILIDELSVRTPVREPQLAEQLVEAPSIVSLIEVIRQPVEQIVDIPVPRGGVRLQCFPQNRVQRLRPLLRTFQLVPDEPFPVGKKVRRWVRTRGRNWVRTLFHPRWLLLRAGSSRMQLAVCGFSSLMVVGNFCAPIQKYGGLGDWFLGTGMG